MKLDLTPFDDVKNEVESKIDTSDFNLPQTSIQTPGMTESALRGIAQGATLGHADELTGLLESLISDKSYQQARDESRQAYKAAQEANPWTYGIGEVAGGFAIPVPAVGSVKGISGLGKLATQGAAIGGLTGLGTSEEEGVKALSDASQGALMGGALSTVVGKAIPSVLKKGKDVFKTTALGEDLADVFTRAESGKSVVGKEELAKNTKALRESIEERLFPLLNKDAKTAVDEAYDAAYKTAREKGTSFDITDIVRDAEKTLKDKKLSPEKFKDAIDTLKRFAGAEEQVTGFKSINPMTQNPEEQAILDQLNKIKAAQDVKVANRLSSLEGSDAENADDLIRLITSGKGKISTDVGQAFDTPLLQASSEGVSPTIRSLKTPQGSGEYSAIKPIKGEVLTTPTQNIDELQRLRNALNDIADKSDSLEKMEVVNLKKRLDDLIQSGADPNSLEFANQLNKLRSEAIGKFGLSNLEINSARAGDVQAREALRDSFLEKITNALGTNRGQVNKLGLEEAFDALKKIEPQKAADLEKDMLEQARSLYLSRQSVQPPIISNDIFSILSGGAKGAVYRGADLAGKVSRWVKGSTPESLEQIANKLDQSGQARYSAMLRKALSSPDKQRTALLFSLAQNPDFRSAVPEVFSEATGE